LGTILIGGVAGYGVSFAQDLEESRAELRKDCRMLGYDESKCECVVSLSEDIGDGLLLGRFVMEGTLVGRGLESESEFANISNAIDSSKFYLQGRDVRDKENTTFALATAGTFGWELHSKCGVVLRSATTTNSRAGDQPGRRD
jgi:hypothetical protein